MSDEKRQSAAKSDTMYRFNRHSYCEFCGRRRWVRRVSTDQLVKDALARHPTPKHPKEGLMRNGRVGYLADWRCYQRVIRYGDPDYFQFISEKKKKLVTFGKRKKECK